MTERDEMIDQIGELMDGLGQVMVRHRLLDELPMDVTVQQLRALAVLYRYGGRSAHDLADLLGLRPTALTGLVDRLESKGYVDRRPDPADRRVRRIDLTPSGAEVLDSLERLRDEKHRQILGRLADEDLARLLRALGPLAKAVREDVEASEGSVDCPYSGGDADPSGESGAVDADLTRE